MCATLTDCLPTWRSTTFAELKNTVPCNQQKSACNLSHNLAEQQPLLSRTTQCLATRQVSFTVQGTPVASGLTAPHGTVIAQSAWVRKSCSRNFQVTQRSWCNDDAFSHLHICATACRIKSLERSIGPIVSVASMGGTLHMCTLSSCAAWSHVTSRKLRVKPLSDGSSASEAVWSNYVDCGGPVTLNLH